jgi:hypothetical protein
MFAGIGLAIGGAVFALAFGYVALSGGRGLMGAKGAAVIVPLIFLGAGGGMGYFAGRARMRAKRLLRNGRTCAATIEKIDATGERINKDSVSLLTVQFEADGRVVQASRSSLSTLRADSVKHVPASARRRQGTVTGCGTTGPLAGRCPVCTQARWAHRTS